MSSLLGRRRLNLAVRQWKDSMSESLEKIAWLVL